MIRGTTPTHTYTLPFETSLIEAVRIIYAQNDKPVICKETADCVLEGKTITTTLTEAETFKFDCKNHVQVQIRVLTTSGQVLATKVMLILPDKCLDTEVMT